MFVFIRIISLALLFTAALAQAQKTYPQRPVRIVVPYPCRRVLRHGQHDFSQGGHVQGSRLRALAMAARELTAFLKRKIEQNRSTAQAAGITAGQ